MTQDVELTMPDLGTTEAEIKVIQWLVEVGQSVRRGQPILEVETDKAAMEVESFAAGVLKEVRAKPDDMVATGEVIAIVESESTAPATPAQPEDKPKKAGSMFARNRAAKEPVPDSGGMALNAVHRTVAKRMLEGKQTIPHFYLQTSADAGPMIARREAASPKVVGWDAFFVCAAAHALQAFERMTCRFSGDRLDTVEGDTISVAVDVHGDLHVLPVSGGAAGTPEEISDGMRKLMKQRLKGDPQVKRLRQGAMGITNLSATGIESFSAIINPPQSCILAIGKIGPVPVAEQDRVVVQQRVALTLSVDHRIAAGKYAAEFLQKIVEEIEGM
ncbi:MAG: 2-oxo acid dehydrogenase subunit E2 [Lentisphaerae bacterium]|nr:2-oxo acid dehydrogenase subunit E2 [Lentisphaerota bacterium]